MLLEILAYERSEAIRHPGAHSHKRFETRNRKEIKKKKARQTDADGAGYAGAHSEEYFLYV